MASWFIADLHLDSSRPESIHYLFEFFSYLQVSQARADALYILGDFFEYWIGDDVLDTPQGQSIRPIVTALAQLKQSGVAVYFIHGNRDFLIGEQFASLSGCELLPEQQVIDLYGTPTLLMHGDSLCTNDVEYQQARALFRSPDWQAQLMNLSIPERLERAQMLRMESQARTRSKAETILDVNQAAVEAVMREYAVTCLIHGHTHRPAVHQFDLDGKTVQRVVLGDWYQTSSFLRVDQHGLNLLKQFE